MEILLKVFENSKESLKEVDTNKVTLHRGVFTLRGST